MTKGQNVLNDWCELWTPTRTRTHQGRGLWLTNGDLRKSLHLGWKVHPPRGPHKCFELSVWHIHICIKGQNICVWGSLLNTFIVFFFNVIWASISYMFQGTFMSTLPFHSRVSLPTLRDKLHSPPPHHHHLFETAFHLDASSHSPSHPLHMLLIIIPSPSTYMTLSQTPLDALP